MAGFTPNGVALKVRSPFDFVSTIVALNKAYLLRNVRESPAGQWIFTRLDQTSMPRSAEGLTIDAFTFGPGRNTCRSDIAVHGERLGHLYFAWIAKN
jgi:hypothetical protein